MKNEVTYSKVNGMKKNIMIYLMIFAVGSLVLRAMNNITINLESSMMEIYIVLMTLLVLSIQVCRLIGVPVKDEKTIREKYIINNVGFFLILWGGIGLHFVSNLIYDHILFSDSNNFTSLFILIGFIVAVVSTKKHDFYLNHKIIEKETKPYYLSVLKNIGGFWLAAIGYATVIYSLSLTLSISTERVMVVISSIILSIMFFSIEYILFSVYEKIDYDEKMMLKEQNSQRFLSKKVILLGLPVIGYAILKAGVYFLYWAAKISENQTNERMFEAITQLLQFWSLDFAIITLFLSFVIYKSIKALPFNKPSLFKYYPILIWLSFAYALYNFAFVMYSLIHPFNINLEILNFMSQNSFYLSLVIMIITLAVHIYFYPYMKINRFPAAKLFLIVAIFPLLNTGGHVIIQIMGNDMFHVMYQVSLLSFIFAIISSLSYYYIYCRMSNDIFVKREMKRVLDDPKVVLSKKLIH
ncbi:MAG: hypothetical protein KKH01_01130 [Firmicutes bacterium]|nr:hypothetical protein [Bacillota bacterium]